MTTSALRELEIREQDSLLAAMRRITDNSREVALVVNDAGELLGVVTDGDIRRGLLDGLGTDAAAGKVMTRDYTSVGPETDRAAVLDLMKARGIRHVPVVDAARRLLGIHFLDDLIASAPRPNSALIMAGGRGTRLHPITQALPKPMVTVAGRPILERLVLQLVGHGVTDIFISLHYMPETIRRYFGDGRQLGCRIEYIMEPEPLGTGGALSLLPQRPAHPLLVMNGDLVMQIDFGGLLDFHRRHGCGATIAVRPFEMEIPFGVVRSENERLTGLQEKPTTFHLINAGVYVLDSKVIELVPSGQMFPMTALFERLLSEKQEVGVFHINSDWIDVGRHEELRRARGES
jgi:dTDP-glucose pyrophosphorylase